VSLRRESSVTCILEKLRSSAIGWSVSRLDTYSPSFEYWTSDPDPVELDGFPARVVFVASVRNGVVSKPPFGPDAAASSQWGTYSLPLPRCNPDCPKPRYRSARRVGPPARGTGVPSDHPNVTAQGRKSKQRWT